MKLAITSSGNGLDSPVDMRFGRAANFIVISLPEGTHEVVANECKLNAAQGAGIQAAEKISSLGVEALITGHCGPKAFRALSAAGVKVYAAPECKVSDAIESFKGGTLKSLESADVEGHWT